MEVTLTLKVKSCSPSILIPSDLEIYTKGNYTLIHLIYRGAEKHLLLALIGFLIKAKKEKSSDLWHDFKQWLSHIHSDSWDVSVKELENGLENESMFAENLRNIMDHKLAVVRAESINLGKNQVKRSELKSIGVMVRTN